MVEKNKLTDIKKQEQTRRVELAMMYLLMETYPKEAHEKLRKCLSSKEANSHQPFNTTVVK